MFDFDARYFVIIAMNLLKLTTNKPWEWDPFDIHNNLTWIKFSILLFFFFFFATTSIRVTDKHIFLHFRNVSIAFTISFVALIILPQVLFWYVYPFILFLAYCSQRLCKLMNDIKDWLKAILAAVPDVRIHITAEHDVGVESVPDEENIV